MPDFPLAAQRLVVEADGAPWPDGQIAREDDAERQALLEAAGERVVRVRWEQAVCREAQTLARASAPPARRRLALSVVISTNQFKNGNHIEVEGTIFKILEFQQSSPARAGRSCARSSAGRRTAR